MTSFVPQPELIPYEAETRAILQDTSKDPTERIFRVLQLGHWPASLFERWACDCAERALQHEVSQGRTPALASWEVIAVKRAWLQGSRSDTELRQAVEQAQIAFHQASIQRSCYEASAAAMDAGRSAEYAVRAAAWALSALEKTDATEETDHLRQTESEWQLQHFYQVWCEITKAKHSVADGEV